MRWLSLVLALSCFLVAAAKPETSLINLRVVDDRGAREQMTVVLGEGKILAVGKNLAPVPGTRVTDCRGLSLLPGFIDCHVHAAFYPSRQILSRGVTTARDLGWNPSAIFKLQTQTRAGGPWLVSAGGMLCAPGGYPEGAGWAPNGTAVPVSSVGEARARVDQMAERGAGVIKVALEPSAGPTLALPVLQGIVARAHQRHLKVTAHLSSSAELDKAMEAGVDELAHFTFDDTTVSDSQLQRMVAQHVAVCPTLHINPSPTRLSNLKRFTQRGGRVLYGTDLGNAGVPPGIDLQELEWMHTAGMSTREVIASATWQAARWLGLPDRGRVEPGLRGDLILVAGDPLADLRVLGRLQQVYYGGRPQLNQP